MKYVLIANASSSYENVVSTNVYGEQTTYYFATVHSLHDAYIWSGARFADVLWVHAPFDPQVVTYLEGRTRRTDTRSAPRPPAL